MAGSKGLLLLLCTLVMLSLARFVLADQYYYMKPPKKYGGYYNGNPLEDDDRDDGGNNSKVPYYTQPAYYKSSPSKNPMYHQAKPIYKRTPIIKPPKPTLSHKPPKPASASPYKPRPIIYKPLKPTLPYKPPQKTPPIYKPRPIIYKPPKPTLPYKPPQKTPPPHMSPSNPMAKPPQEQPPTAYKPTPPLYPSPSTPQTPSYNPPSSSWQRQWLDPHNAARAVLGLPPMVWSDKVAQYAQSWANQRKATGCGLQHSDGPYGENIFWGSGFDYGPAECVAAWVGEKKYYNYADNSCAPGQQCGHYTQIVWASSLNLGCAKVQCNSGQIFMTCNYDPPGNWIGSKPY